MSPHKPTRENATAATDPREIYREPAPATGASRSASGIPESGRKERGSAAENAKHTPHLTENYQGADLQDSDGGAADVEALPATAAGEDRMPNDEGGIDPESMYDRRPEEDKDRPPSSPRSP